VLPYFSVRDRSTGKPLKGVKATLMVEKYDYSTREYRDRKRGTYITDENGFFTVPSSTDYRSFFVKFQYEEDHLNTSTSFYQYRRYNQKKERIKTWFFTDRSIYRPGQTIYFKGTMIETVGENNKLLVDHTTNVALYDVNYQKVSELKLVTNEYGSFSGSFIAPSSSLNGQMHLKNLHGQAYFAVEEYKRPKFEVKFNPVKGSYKLEDEVKATGLAKAFSGAFIDGAEVSYRVVRNATFPSWCYYWRGYWPSSAQMEIVHGNTTTNEKGEFDVVFTAIPDKSISKDLRPTYNYTIYADVTDINGETHSTQQYVRVGYTSLTLSVIIKEQLSSKTLDTFKIRTNNLSGEKLAASGSVKIFKLKTPTATYRKRKWQRPDLFMLTKQEHEKAFPHDVYDDEDNKYKWARGKKVFDHSFDTEKQST